MDFQTQIVERYAVDQGALLAERFIAEREMI